MPRSVQITLMQVIPSGCASAVHNSGMKSDIPMKRQHKPRDRSRIVQHARAEAGLRIWRSKRDNWHGCQPPRIAGEDMVKFDGYVLIRYAL